MTTIFMKHTQKSTFAAKENAISLIKKVKLNLNDVERKKEKL